MRVLLIHNPAAGRPAVQRQLPQAIAVLESGGWAVTHATTQGPGDAYQLASQAAANGFQAVLAAGGDGTVNGSVNGLGSGLGDARDTERPIPLGILPLGTANVLARELGLPNPAWSRQRLSQVAERLLTATVRRIDLGLAASAAGQRLFTCWAGIGIDAAITAYVEGNPASKRRFGALSFLPAALRHMGELRRAPVYTVTLDEERWTGTGMLAVVSNIRHYALVLELAPAASFDDGLLDVTLLRGVGLAAMVKHLWRLSSGRHLVGPHVSHGTGGRIVIETSRPQPVHLDAEPFGTTPITVRVLPRSLPVMIPRRADPRTPGRVGRA